MQLPLKPGNAPYKFCWSDWEAPANKMIKVFPFKSPQTFNFNQQQKDLAEKPRFMTWI